MEQNKSALLVGVGGQGAILTAKVLVNGLMQSGCDVKMSEVHGMSQRGGSVSTQVHWGKKVYSPVIGKGAADIVVAFEKMEAVRYAEYLKIGGVAVINDYEMPSATTAAGLCAYPEGCLEAMQAHFRCYTLNAAEIARTLGSVKCMNIVLFGSMVKALHMDAIDWAAVVADTVPAVVKCLDYGILDEWVPGEQTDAIRRKRVEKWKSGFWKIAHEAQVPVILEYFHYPEKVIGIGDCSGKDTDKFEKFGLTALPAEKVAAPLVAECIACLECKVTDYIKEPGILLLQGVKAWIDNERKERRTFHANGDGTFVVDGESIDLRHLMADKLPF